RDGPSLITPGYERHRNTVSDAVTVILRYSEGSGSFPRMARSFGVPQDDNSTDNNYLTLNKALFPVPPPAEWRRRSHPRRPAPRRDRARSSIFYPRTHPEVPMSHFLSFIVACVLL